MESTKYILASPETHETQRVAEIKALSYEERLYRMFALIEVSFELRNAALIQSKNK